MARMLGELLVASGRLTEDQLAEALRTQSLFGGPLGAHLMQLGFVDDTGLAEALAELHGVAPVTRAELAEAPPDVLALVPAAFARRHRVLPFRRDEEGLHVALENPGDSLALKEVSAITGLPVVPHVAPEAVLRQALAALERRGRSEEDDSRLARLGQRLARAETRDDVLEAVLEATAPVLASAGLFLLRGSTALLWSARGFGRVETGRSIPLDGDELLAAAVREEGPVERTLPVGDRGSPVLEALGSPSAGRFVALAVRLNGRAVVLLAGTPSEADRTRVDEDLRRIAKLAALALESVILRRKILAESGAVGPARR
ncbi:MAG: hypothetical protein D6718_08720 [Acidobacteria bacterium]|nr:MAG: hypothetical protein D6718_08720 [Acidobacteriota bacterium]